MTFDSSTETVAVLYDIENAPFEMLDFTLGKARKFFPCRMIVVSDWEKHPEQKRWNRLMVRKGFTFRQIDRKIDGKNSLDYALFDMAKILRDEGVRRFLIVTTDSDFVTIAQMLREKQAKKNHENVDKDTFPQPAVAGKNVLQVRLPKSLFDKLQKRKRHENVEMEQLVTYLLMRGLND